MIQGRLYDGVTGHPHEVNVAFGADEIGLSQAGGWSDRVEAAQLRRLEPVPGLLRLGRKDQSGWRLLLPSNCVDQVQSLLGKEERYGRWIDRVGLIPALVVCGVITASVVGIGYVAPHWIAPHVPMSWERNVGSAMVGDFGDLRCRNADGQQALEALVERVSPGATKGPDGIKVAALDVSMFNAAALPGGYVVVFKPAITETNPDALAGILAHEVAHVRRRHVAEALIREFGIGALVRMMGGNIGANAEQIVSLSYTRQNEAQADADAIQMLRRANISPFPIGLLMARLGAERSVLNAQFLESHPAPTKRALRFEAAFDPHIGYQPALSRSQWTSLVHICDQPKQA